ncbi:PAS domain S-box protein [Arcicella rigui]|uniref:histidine kinase n=1 Tax=Arcicella rigui TaxID=797020 RepID=A0ABU5Q4P0_9BACT|nr:PAS domain S-box protein [Arcicella rigui]MEA5137794.1 PAS domain S-box protein [Arcicella rigui]
MNTAAKEELYSLIKADFSIFDFIQESALDGFGFFDTRNSSDGWMNPKFWATLGYNSDEIPQIQPQWQHLIHPEDVDTFSEHYRNPSKSHEITIRYKHKNDSTIWLKCRTLAINNPKEELSKVIISFTDVTELMRKEDFLERCNAAAMVGYWELEIEKQKLYWSNFTKKIHEVDDDFEPDVNAAINFYEEGENRDKIRELVTLAISEGQNYDLDFKIITAKGNPKWVRVIIQSEFYAGHCIRIYGTFQDIHAQKIAQEELLKEKQKLQSVVEGTNAGIWEWNVQTGETFFNERWAAIVGYTLEELAPINIDTWIKLAHPDDLLVSEQKIQDCFDKKTELYQCECRMKHKNGHWVWVLDRGKIVSWTKEGLPLMMYGTHSDISEQKKKIERDTTFIEHTPTAIAMFDNDLRYLAVSEKWRIDYHLEGIDLIGKSHYEVFPEISDEWKAVHRECLKGKSIRKDEDPFVRLNGTIQWIKWEVKPWFTDDGSTGGLIMFTEDITEKKVIAQVLSEKNTLLETILDSIDVGIVACDKDAKLTLFNNTTTRWHGLSLSDMEPSNLAEYYDLCDMEGKILSFEEVPLIRTLKEGHIKNLEIQIAPKNGKKRIVSTSGSQLRGPNNELFGAVVAMHDITQTKQALEDLKISEEAFRGNFENAAIGMALLDIDGKWLKINQTLCQIMGYSVEEFEHLTFQEITFPDDLKADLELVQELIEGKRTHYQMEKRYIHKKGNIINAILAVSMVRNQANQPLYFVSQIIDITLVKNVEKEIKSLLDVTKDQNERLKNFAHIVSHNLRSHSGNISMMMDILFEESPELLENENLSLLKSAASNLSETIAHLNEVVLMNSAVIDNLKSVNLYQAIENGIKNVSGFAKESQVIIRNITDTDNQVLAVPAYLDSIVLNFLTNAIKYSSPERESYVQLSTSIKNDFVVLQIEDNGLGIDLKRHGAKLFGLYKTFHSHEDARGVGLFITKNQVEAMGGKIEVTSEVNKGTTFSIYLKHEKN